MNSSTKRLISTKQLMYSVAAFITASTMLTRSLYMYTKNDTWITVILAGFISYAIISLYGRLVLHHPGASLIKINNEVFGAIIGKIISMLYIFFFLTLTVFNTLQLGDFVKFAVLPGTPINLIYFVFIFSFAYAARKGTQNMTRYATVIVALFIAALIFNSLLLLNKMHLENFLPMLTLPVKDYLLGTHFVVFLPFCEIFIFMMFASSMQKPEGLTRAIKRGFIIGAPILLFIVLRDILVLGNYAMVEAMPTYATIRQIDIGDVLTRLEIIYAVTLICVLFFKVSILFYGTVSGFSEMLGIKQYEIFIYISGVLVIVCANMFFQSSAEQSKWNEAAATYATFFLFVLPVITVIVSEFRKSAKREAPAESQQQ